MYSFSDFSLGNLRTVHETLFALCNDVIKYMDIRVLEGYRSPERQHELYMQNKTTIDWKWDADEGAYVSPSKHGSLPSRAVDVVPCPIQWADPFPYHMMAGIFRGIAFEKYNIALRWGGDWDGDFSNKDQRFHDLPHFELPARTLNGEPVE